jgi:hypothetical protein
MGTIRGGHLAVDKGNRVHVVWFGAARSSGSDGAPLLYTRLNEAGTAFEPQRNLMQFTTMLDGGGSIGADASLSVTATAPSAPTPCINRRLLTALRLTLLWLAHHLVCHLPALIFAIRAVGPQITNSS